jgi:hypothetical protein
MDKATIRLTHFAKQHAIIANLERNGHDIMMALQLLDTFEGAAHSRRRS